MDKRILYKNIIVFIVLMALFGSSGFLVFAQTTTTYPNPLGTNSIIELIARILRFVYAIAIPLAVIMIIYSGILFLTAGGKEAQVTKARKTIIWVIVGIAIILIGRGIITLIKDILGAP